MDEADVDYPLAEANKWLATPLTKDDVVGIYSGLRPLLSAGTGEDGTATLSREHAVLRPRLGSCSLRAVSARRIALWRQTPLTQLSRRALRSFGTPCRRARRTSSRLWVRR